MAAIDLHKDCFSKTCTNLALASAFVIWNFGPKQECNTRPSAIKHLQYLRHKNKTSHTTSSKCAHYVLLTFPLKGKTSCNVTRAQKKIFRTHQTGDQSQSSRVSTASVASDSKKNKKGRQQRKGWRATNQQCKKYYLLFFCPLYCWAFFFCLGTDWGISLLPWRRQEDEKPWDVWGFWGTPVGLKPRKN